MKPRRGHSEGWSSTVESLIHTLDKPVHIRQCEPRPYQCVWIVQIVQFFQYRLKRMNCKYFIAAWHNTVSCANYGHTL